MDVKFFPSLSTASRDECHRKAKYLLGIMTPEADICSAIVPISFAPFQELQRLNKLSLPLMI